jgi:signal transduction histidine kinase
LKDFGLQKAIEEFCSRFARTGIALDCHCFPERLSPHLEMAIYRISQELVNNLVKHSGASRGRLEVYRDKDYVYIEAQDNGKGMKTSINDGDRKSKGIGLQTIQDRLKLLQGTLEIESSSQKGTLILIYLPLSPHR